MDKDDIRLVALLQRVPRANRFVGLFVKSDDCDSHPLLFTTRATRVNCTLALSLSKIERFARKTKERIPHPACKYYVFV